MRYMLLTLAGLTLFSAFLWVLRESRPLEQCLVESAQNLPKKEHYWQFLTSLMKGVTNIDGFMIDKEAEYYQRLAAEPFVNTVCEIGFNAGHSTAMWFTAGERKLKAYSFDLGNHNYAHIAKKFIDWAFPGRLHLTLGDSRETVPAFTSNATNKGLVCDIIHVDGGHAGDIPLADLRNMRPLAGTNTILLIDDVNCDKTWCIAPQQAWDQMKAEGEIEECQCFSMQKEDEFRGWCVGRYVKPGHKTHETSNVCSIIAERHSTLPVMEP